MKKKKINLDNTVKDRQGFQPNVLISLENQRATQRYINQNRLSEEYISNPTTQQSSKKTLFSRKSSNSIKEFLSNKDNIMKQEANMFSPQPQLQSNPKSFRSKNRLKKQTTIEPLSQTFYRKQKKLLSKVDQLKQSRAQKAQKIQASIFANTGQLNSVLKEQRKKQIAKNFIKKLRKKKIDEHTYLQALDKLDGQPSFLQINGCELHQNLINMLKILQIIFTFILVFFNSILLVYKGILQQDLLVIKTCAVIFYIINFILSMTSTKKEEGKTITNIIQIWQCIGTQKIIMDLINIIILLIDVSTQLYAMTFLRLVIIVKLPLVLKSLQEIQIKLITNAQTDKYWSLIKIMLFNFCFAHILAVILSAMADINPNDNWMIMKQIYSAQWYQKYIWAYYWGTNIMLTVGFGDISATNYKQALCLIFIETVSCVVLAYNVSCVGDIIMNIKARDHQKKNQIKLFKKMTQSNPISTQLNWKITNFIQQSINLKKNFNYEEQQKFIINLPKYLKYDFLKETNHNVFHQLPFFRFLMQRTIYNLAQNIQMIMAHPEEIIINKNDDFNLWILRSGEVALTQNRRGSDFNGEIVDKISVKGSQPTILSLNFITKKQLPFQVKSLQYSSFYFLQFQKLMQTIKQNSSDFMYYCFNRDKIKNIPDEFEVHLCSICKDRYHYKFDCPLLHHMPNRDKIIFSYIRQTKLSKIKNRMPFLRQKVYYKPFQVNKYYKIRKQSENQDATFVRCTNSLLGQSSRNKYQTNSVVFEESQSLKNGFKSDKQIATVDNFVELKQFIRGELGRILLVSEDADPVWLINSDTLVDYTSYFKNDNPRNVANKIYQIKQRKRNLVHLKKA